LNYVIGTTTVHLDKDHMVNTWSTIATRIRSLADAFQLHQNCGQNSFISARVGRFRRQIDDVIGKLGSFKDRFGYALPSEAISAIDSVTTNVTQKTVMATGPIGPPEIRNWAISTALDELRDFVDEMESILSDVIGLSPRYEATQPDDALRSQPEAGDSQPGELQGTDAKITEAVQKYLDEAGPTPSQDRCVAAVQKEFPDVSRDRVREIYGDLSGRKGKPGRPKKPDPTKSAEK
jgi:hypothetical protein